MSYSGSTLPPLTSAFFHMTELTDLGKEQGKYVNTILAGGGWFQRMRGNLTARAIVSPLSRCLLVGPSLHHAIDSGS